MTDTNNPEATNEDAHRNHMTLELAQPALNPNACHCQACKRPSCPNTTQPETNGGPAR